jgi:uncharacterized membrane protein YfcA
MTSLAQASASLPILVLIGLSAGLTAGLFGVGGGLIIVPALIYLVGFSAQKAIGTSLAVLLPPVGLGAFLEYYRHGNVDVRAAVAIAVSLFAGAWLSASLANQLDHVKMKILFGGFVVLMGIYTIVEALIERSAIPPR